MSEEAELEEDEGSGRKRGVKTLRNVQKSQLEKLMANPVSMCTYGILLDKNLMKLVSTGQAGAYPRAS